MIQNSGISFGWQIPAIRLIGVLLLLTLIWWVLKSKEWRWWLIIIGGALNLGERFRFGYVTDYWKIPVVPIYNNINDWLIFVGAILLIWKYYTKTKH